MILRAGCSLWREYLKDAKGKITKTPAGSVNFLGPKFRF
jgi:hypothetical protein